MFKNGQNPYGRIVPAGSLNGGTSVIQQKPTANDHLVNAMKKAYANTQPQLQDTWRQAPPMMGNAMPMGMGQQQPVTGQKPLEKARVKYMPVQRMPMMKGENPKLTALKLAITGQ